VDGRVELGKPLSLALKLYLPSRERSRPWEREQFHGKVTISKDREKQARRPHNIDPRRSVVNRLAKEGEGGNGARA